MKKAIVIASMAIAMTATSTAQRVYEDSFNRLQVHFETPQLTVGSRAYAGEKYTALTLEGYTLAGEVGTPALPTQIHYLEIPFCSRVEVEVSNVVYEPVSTLGAPMMLYPQQPSRSKSDTTAPAVVVNREVYETDAYYGMPLATVEPLGVNRDRNLALLRFSPVSVNPVTGQIVVCRSADVTVKYVGADEQYTVDYYRRYHTPAFHATPALNNLFAKVRNGQAPVRMAIVVGNIAGVKDNSYLRRFVEWKRTQGMLVDVIYREDLADASSTGIAAAVKTLYTEASSSNPAPTYLLLVGDHAQLPAFNSSLSTANSMHDQDLDDHVSDHYYTTWTDDNIRDCYLGRFSVTDTSMLNNMISKTLLYEQYGFADDSYLGRAVLISGVDVSWWEDPSDYAYTYADPTMDYVARYYMNADNGYTDVVYYKNNIDFAPAGVTVTGSSRPTSTATALRTLYSEGIGWINYSAHGFESGWGHPSFTVNQVNQMTNNGKPSFMIGNCCLSNHFDTEVCFGEALLRKGNNAGAIGYVGGTNSTFWDADFYFSVGVRSNISNTMNPSYDATKMGSYDRLFHTHNESFSNYAISAGAMLHAGLMSVNGNQTSPWERDMVEYYWEIYELMGDPSLMPWLGVADELAFTAEWSGGLKVNTTPRAYVALVDADLTLLAAAYADASGTAELAVPASADVANAFFSITAQNHRPLIRNYSESNVAIAQAGDVRLTMAPNPATSSCTLQADGLERVEVLDMMGRMVQQVQCSDRCTLALDAMAGGLYLVRAYTRYGVVANKLIVSK